MPKGIWLLSVSRGISGVAIGLEACSFIAGNCHAVFAAERNAPHVFGGIIERDVLRFRLSAFILGRQQNGKIEIER